MRVAEIFRSIQGEGLLTGTESIFVRTSGCNLRCRWCDTPYASWLPEGEDLSIEEIVARVAELAQPDGKSPDAKSNEPVAHVVLTGGEPMLFAELLPLAAELRNREMHITIETAGTLYLPVACDLMSISPKLTNSTPTPEQGERWVRRHEANRSAPDVIRRLIAEYDYQVKFVIDTLDDCREVEAYLAEFPEIDRGRAMLMPQAANKDDLAARGEWLAPYCSEHELVYCPRRQIEWFGPVRGT